MRRGIVLFLLLFSVAFAVWLRVLDRQITTQFDGRRWPLPARVFAQPLELYAGLTMDAAQLRSRLDSLGYRAVAGTPAAGQYTGRGTRVRLATRPFVFWDGPQAAADITVSIDAGRIDSLTGADGTPLPLARLDPQMIGSIVPGSGEDRIVVHKDSLPSLLPAALVAIEDQHFYRHHGLDFSAILRAAWVNLRAGGVRQGGSTITQQLVKSYFLDNQRTFRRKAREAAMALLLDARFDKQEIMLGYINEVYMGQDGARAVHGFGLASRYYFGRPLAELESHQIALLVALVRGPSLYDPRRHPQRARERRDRVLNLLAERKVLSPEAVHAARSRPLDVTATPGRSSGRFPAFMDVVRAQLARDYRREDLSSAGLNIFTTLEVGAQVRAEAICAGQLARVEQARGLPGGSLEVGAVVSDPQNGELLAVVGGRRSGFAGYNRALLARRPIGSLIKPVVYLTAFATGDYHLASVLVDEPLTLTLADGEVWAPRNYTGSFAGELPLYRALAESINLPTVRVGLDVGAPRVARQLRRLGVSRSLEVYPSLLLGAVDLTPMEVAQVYGSFASGGYRVPLRAVRAVLDTRGAPLKRYGLTVDTAADTLAIEQVNAGLRAVVTHGTGRGVAALLRSGITVAGKTGSSNDLRDGWFAGFSADRLAVVWVGRDDNATMGLTGSQSALPVWAALMNEFADRALEPAAVVTLVDTELDYASGALGAAHCGETILLPLPRGTTISVLPGCRVDRPDGAPQKGLRKWLRDRFGD